MENVFYADIRQKKDPTKIQRNSFPVLSSGLFPCRVLPCSTHAAGKVIIDLEHSHWHHIRLRCWFADRHSKRWTQQCLIPAFCLFRRVRKDSEKVNESSPLLGEWGHTRSHVTRAEQTSSSASDWLRISQVTQTVAFFSCTVLVCFYFYVNQLVLV